MNYYIDLFCGAGGTTTGVENAKGCKVIVGVNHDPLAIKSQKANYPHISHFTEDVRNPKVLKHLANIVAKIRREDPLAKIFIWASLECTNFSKAKGGLPKDADSRTLAECLYRFPHPTRKNKFLPGYIQVINPDGLWIENVEEFMAWGPLRIKEDKRNSVKNISSALKLAYSKKTLKEEYSMEPLCRKNGQDYMRWVKEITSFGYAYNFKILNSADFGEYTSRKRLFIQFTKKDIPVVWPEPTHSKTGYSDIFGHAEPWKPVKDVLDFTDKGRSIFTRKKPLSPRSLERILAGCIKHVANGDTSFIKKYYSGRPMGKVISVDGPAGTIKTADGQALVQVDYLLDYHGNSTTHPLNTPSPTITTKDKIAKVNVDFTHPEFMVKYYGTSDHQNINEPAGTLTTKDRYAPVWLDKQYGGADNHQSIDKPAGSVLKNDKHCLMQAEAFLVKNYTSGVTNSSIDVPAGSILTVPKENLVTTVKPWLMDTNFNNVGKSVEEPSPTILASRHHSYLVNPQYNSKGSGINDPCFTLIARMDKSPPYLVQVENGDFAIIIYDTDPEPMKKIKMFMAAYGIVDIKMRMLKVPELLRIQGFPSNYILKGNQTNQKKFIGNSVVPKVAQLLAETQALKMQSQLKQAV